MGSDPQPDFKELPVEYLSSQDRFCSSCECIEVFLEEDSDGV